MSVINFEEKKLEKKIHNFVNNYVLTAPLPNHETNILGKACDISKKIIRYSGDCEGRGPRKIVTCAKQDLLRAATTQFYSFKQIGNILRLSFDGDWFYDLYLDEAKINSAVIEAFHNALQSEIDLNICKEGLRKAKFE